MILDRLGMQEGESIESRMVTRRIEAAQKKVEERHFEARKSLLEYDEVMDEQRKRVYSFRQAILEDKNCRDVILEMIHKQIEKNLTAFLQRDFGASNCAAFAAHRLSCEFEARDFRGLDFNQAESYAKDHAARMAETFVQDAIDENLPGDEADDVDQSEWNWEAMAAVAQTKWGLKVRDRDLKKVGRDNIGSYLVDEARKAIEQVDLSEGKVFLEEDFNFRWSAAWVQQKFGLKLDLEEIKKLDAAALKKQVVTLAEAAYDEKEAEYPVLAGFYRYVQSGPGKQPKIDRDGLIAWAKERFQLTLDAGDLAVKTPEEIRVLLTTHSRQSQAEATKAIAEMQAKIAPLVEGADARQLVAAVVEKPELETLATWAKERFGCRFSAEQLGELEVGSLESKLLHAIEDRYRAEMRRMERMLLLQIVDTTWKDHLLVMDRLRSSVGLVGYAQVDPKVEYKREGMKLFEQMWQAIDKESTDLIFKMEQLDEDFVGSTWNETSARHDAAPGATEEFQRSQEQTNSANQSDARAEPIRNRGVRLGRNDPCHCGSGKKYKNCHMRVDQAGGRDVA